MRSRTSPPWAIGLVDPEPLLEAIVENTTAAIFVKDLEGRYVMINRTCETLWGVSRHEIVGKTDFEVLPAANAAALHRHDQQVINSGRSVEFEERVEFPTGPRTYMTSKSPIFDAHDRCRGICGVATDITERQKTHEALVAGEEALTESEARLRQQTQQLAELHRRKDEFLAILAHELRNPLAPIKQAAELIATPSIDGPKVTRAAELIDRQVNHLSRLIEDLTDAARLTRGRIELHLAPLTLSQVVSRVRELIEPQLRQRGHRLELSMPDREVSLSGDSDRLVQVLGNLLENAARYTDDPGVIHLETRCEGPEVVIAVRDPGRGIAAERLANLFEPFSRAGIPHESPSSGLGLGLSIVKQLVELHGGSVTARSDGAARGSEFVVRLPLLESDPAKSASAPEAGHAGAARRVLVVDDNEDAAEMLAAMLETDGHQVSVCHRGDAVAELVRCDDPDVVLLDIGLPDMDGNQVARRLREEHGDAIRLIAITGYGQRADRECSLAAGFDHHLVKPVDYRALRDHL